ncbi:hypothetical protein F9K79_19925 [Ochrobactrum sp. Kaboul]|nr:hypothetical protein F9K79_19925 [Ochrobactrum sp. Kaboul]
MIRLILLVAVPLILGGCASLNYPLPKCDGYARRPLNRAMWQWEGNSVSQPGQSKPGSSALTTPYREAPKSQAAFAHLDIDSSYRPCTE